MAFYEFRQNNSGGSFDDEMGLYVFVEASNPDEANDLAQGVGVYFDGCEDGRDCPCCGDRWHAAWGTSEAETRDELRAVIERELPYAEGWSLPIAVLFRGAPHLIKIARTEDLSLV